MSVSTTVEVDVVSCGPEGIDRPLGDAAWSLHVVDGVITDVVEAPRAKETLRVLVPTLVNAHEHGRGRGTQLLGVRDAPLDEWIPAFVAAVPADSQHEQVSVALARMRDGGIGGVTVCVNPTTPDRDREVRIAAEAARHVGIRAAIAYPLTSGPRGTYRSGRERSAAARAAAEAALDEIDALADEVAGDGIEIVYHPVGPQWVGEDLLQALAGRSAATGRLWHMHLLETAQQRRWADETYTHGMLAAFDAMGLLSPRAWFAHGVHLRPDEMGLLAARGCGVVVNVSSNLRLASGLPPLTALAAAGGDVAAGLDGMTLEDDLDMWAELRLVRGLWQAESHTTVPAADVLAMATGRAGAALGASRPRPVCTGSPADFVVHDLAEWTEVARLPHWPAPELVLAGASRHTVDQVWCRGRRVHQRHRDAAT